MPASRFITFEGIDGSGKTTQWQRLGNHLKEQGHRVVLTREPGGTGLAEAIRGTLLNSASVINPRAELLLFGAARAQHVQEIIRPALERGEWVLCDRFGDSSVAYQGGGLGLDPEFVATMNQFATGGLHPELTFLLDIEPRHALKRRADAGEDRIEARGLEFQERVRAAYLAAAKRAPERWLVLDASASVDSLTQRIADSIVDCIVKRAAASGKPA